MIQKMKPSQTLSQIIFALFLDIMFNLESQSDWMSIRLDVNQTYGQSSNLPLCLLFNARSVFNKSENLTEMLQQIGPDICIISETFERERKRLDSILNIRQFKKVQTNFGKNQSTGWMVFDHIQRNQILSHKLGYHSTGRN